MGYAKWLRVPRFHSRVTSPQLPQGSALYTAFLCILVFPLVRTSWRRATDKLHILPHWGCYSQEHAAFHTCVVGSLWHPRSRQAVALGCHMRNTCRCGELLRSARTLVGDLLEHGHQCAAVAKSMRSLLQLSASELGKHRGELLSRKALAQCLPGFGALLASFTVTEWWRALSTFCETRISMLEPNSVMAGALGGVQ